MEATNKDDCAPVSMVSEATTSLDQTENSSNFSIAKPSKNEKRTKGDDCLDKKTRTESNLETLEAGPSESKNQHITQYLGTIDQRQLNAAAATRMNLQADYDFLLLKRQTRLKLLVEHWFEKVKSKQEDRDGKGKFICSVHTWNLIFYRFQ